MAFTVKNSKCFTIFKFRKFVHTDYLAQRRLSSYNRHSSVLFWIHPSHSNHVTYSNHHKLLQAHSQLASVSHQRFVSTEDQTHKLSEMSSQFSSGNEVTHSSSAKVFFVDSANDVSDKSAAVTNPMSDSYSYSSDSTVHSPITSADTSNVPVTDLSTDVLPMDTLTDMATTVANLAEPSLASLGLASNWTPVGLVQQLIELMHINSYMPMPWWLTIVTGTVIARILMFPIFVKTQRSSAKFAYVMPQIQAMQARFNAARRSGNMYEATRAAQEIGKFMKTHDVNPVKNALMPMAQFPVFISYFLALRKMANLPVESMKYGGISWITDLTIPDPYYIMPIVCSATLYVVLKVGADTGVRMENMQFAKYFLIAMPIILFPFSINFPSAVLFYWCTNNFLTLGMVLLMKQKAIREYFNIPAYKKPDEHMMPKKKGFVAGIKEAMEDQRAIKNIEERKRIDDIRFRKAGTGPIPRTYSYDPTKPRPADAAAAAAKMHSKTKS